MKRQYSIIHTLLMLSSVFAFCAPDGVSTGSGGGDPEKPPTPSTPPNTTGDAADKPGANTPNADPTASSTGAGRSDPASPGVAKGDNPNVSNADIQQRGPNSGGVQKQPFSATEADGAGDGVQQDAVGAPGTGADQRTESPAERTAQQPAPTVEPADPAERQRRQQEAAQKQQ